MTLIDILNRLQAEGYADCRIDLPYQVHVKGLGEIELAYGEARLFDAKHPWPGYGDHPLHKSIDDLFADVAATWPLPKAEIALPPEPEAEITLASEDAEEPPQEPPAEAPNDPDQPDS